MEVRLRSILGQIWSEDSQSQQSSRKIPKPAVTADQPMKSNCRLSSQPNCVFTIPIFPDLRALSRLTDDLSLPTLASTPDSVLSALEEEILNLKVPDPGLQLDNVSAYSFEESYTPSFLSLGDIPESRSRM